MFSGSLIRSGNNAKTIKGDGEYETAIMYLAPADLALAGRTVCPLAELAGCKSGCLNTAGRGIMSNVQQARVNKTLRYFKDRAQFMADLVKDLEKFVRYCKRKGVKPVVRLNGTSDIQWEKGHDVYRVCPHSTPVKGEPRVVGHKSIMAAFPEVQFYDYTKVIKRVYADLPENYRLVVSYSNATPDYADLALAAHLEGRASLAVVYRTKEMRDHAIKQGHAFVAGKVIDGDETDMRFLDPENVIVGLYAKGPAKKDTTGFVVDIPTDGSTI